MTVYVSYCVICLCCATARQADLLPMSCYEEHKPSDAPPVYAMHWQYFHFVMSLRNLVDLAAILPFFIHAAVPSINVNNNFVRILRLVRVFGLMNRHPTIKMMLSVVVKTIIKSSYALGVLLLLSIIGVIFFAAIIYGVEGGEFHVNVDYPDGVYLRKTWEAGKSILDVSPFNSMGTCIYYVITTMTTVGYGDLSPTTVFGRAVANFVMYCGVVLLALPIGVISSNFSDIYHKDLRISRHGKPLDEEAVDWYECEDASDGEEAVKTRRATVMLMPSQGRNHEQMIKTLQDRIELDKQIKNNAKHRTKHHGNGKKVHISRKKKSKIHATEFSSIDVGKEVVNSSSSQYGIDLNNEESMVIDGGESIDGGNGNGNGHGHGHQFVVTGNRRSSRGGSGSSYSSRSVSSVSDSSRNSSSDSDKSGSDVSSICDDDDYEEKKSRHTSRKYRESKTRSHRIRKHHQKRSTKMTTRELLMPWMPKKKLDGDQFATLSAQVTSLERTLAEIKATLRHSSN